MCILLALQLINSIIKAFFLRMFFILHAQHLTQLNFIANTILCQAQLRYTSSISHNSFLIKTRISKAIFYYKILILWISTVSVSAYEPKPPYILHAQIRHKQFYYQIRTDNPYHTGQRENRSHQVGRRSQRYNLPFSFDRTFRP